MSDNDDFLEVVRLTNVSKLRPTSPRIIQILVAPDGPTWQGRLLGLGSDGVTYVCNRQGRWEPNIPNIEYRTHKRNP